MKKTITIALSLILSLSLFAQTEKDKVWNLVVQFEKALVAKDSVQLDKLLVKDFVGATPTGMSYNKQEYIRFHCKPNIGLMNLQTGDMMAASIRFYGNTAIVNRRVSVQRKDPTGTMIDATIQRIEVLIKENNQWIFASGQGTQVVAVPK